MRHILSHFRHNLIAYAALFVALGGTGYAAFSLPAGSVGTRQIRDHSITASKLDARSIGGYVLAWAHVRSDGHVLSGSRGAVAVHTADVSPASVNYLVGWLGVKLSSRCAPVATLDSTGPLSSRGSSVETSVFPKWAFTGARRTHGQVNLIIANFGDQNVPDNFYLAVVC